jgi:hypothetical protein
LERFELLKSVEAVVVNHNTSAYAELAVRSLALAASRTDTDVRITLVDNHSTDDTAALRAAVAECGGRWELSRWPAGQQKLTTHGDVLRDFVLDRPAADAFLFVESDINFFEPDALAVMLAELTAEPAVWAVGARLLTGQVAGPATFREALHRKRRTIELTAHISLVTDDGGTSTMDMFHAGRRIPRCHPGCALIRNSEPFQLAARHLGLSAAWTWSNDLALGGLSDTLALVSNVMLTHRQRHIISSASVIHYWHGTRVGFTDHHRRLVRHLSRGEVAEFVAAGREGLVGA